MTDERYAFISDVRERKNVARSAFYKRSGSKSKACSLPSDSLTAKQLKERNGDVVVYEMNKPHTFKEVSHWPKEYQVQYYNGLKEKFNVDGSMIAEMLGVSRATLQRNLPRLGIDCRFSSRKVSETDILEFKNFSNIEVTGKENVEAEKAEEEKKQSFVVEEPTIRGCNLIMTGNADIILAKISRLTDPSKKYNIHISIEEIIEIPETV